MKYKVLLKNIIIFKNIVKAIIYIKLILEKIWFFNYKKLLRKYLNFILKLLLK